jgi:hypothetical protein
MNVIVSPGGFERFFPTIEARGLAATDIEVLAAIGEDFGIEVVGPPLSDVEAERIMSAVTALA